MKLLISACLLGTPCRYDGRSKPAENISKLMLKHTLIPVCPEMMGGLSTPRLPCEIRGNKVICQNGEDRTLQYMNGAKKCLEIFKKENCDAVLLKTKSPSCGKGEIYDGSFSRSLREGNGVTARLLLEHGIEVITEKEL